jgi:hypothetical protein
MKKGDCSLLSILSVARSALKEFKFFPPVPSLSTQSSLFYLTSFSFITFHHDDDDDDNDDNRKHTNGAKIF